jgi:antitoxin component of RelBE/YafQ-DinJ toxin-antitoxin module
MATGQVRVCVDDQLASQTEDVLKELGMDMKTAILIFLHQVANKEFDLNELKTRIKKRPRNELCGILKGKVWYADDFDEPIVGMEEYS